MRHHKDPALRAIEEWTGHRGNLFIRCEPGPPNDDDPGTRSILKALAALLLIILFTAAIAWLSSR